MGNTNQDVLVPEFWANAFDQINKGQWPIQRLVDRNEYENKLGNFGDTVNVPISPTFVAADWTPGNAITTQDVAQTTAQVVLNKSKSVPFALSAKDLSLSPYNLIQSYGVPAAEALLAQLNTDGYLELLKAYYLVDATAGLTESKIIDARTRMVNNKAAMNRSMIMNPDDWGTLLKLAGFQHVNTSGSEDGMVEGQLSRKFGFNMYETQAISKYTPFDLTGAVNNGAGYSAGAKTMTVNGFNDDAGLIRAGDVFTVAGDTVQHVVQSTTLTGGDTTSITFEPGLGANVVDTAVVTFIGSKSIVGFTPNAMALAARPYGVLPQQAGVMSTIINYDGIPIRISIFHDGKLGLIVQYDILYGYKLIDPSRVVRVLTV